MCKRCIILFFRSYLQLFNVLHAVAGLIIAGVGVYMLEQAIGEISKVITAIGAIVFFVGTLGWVAVSRKIRCLLKLYVLFMSILCIAQATVCILLLTDEDQILAKVPSSDNKNYHKIQEWIRNNIPVFIIIEAALAGVEFLLVTFACCYAGDMNYQKLDSVQTPLLGTGESLFWVDDTEEFNDHCGKHRRREIMRAKYNLDDGGGQIGRV